jgi:hypothetical protein
VAELVFILADFFSAADADADRSTGAGLPALPLLEMLFARAQRSPLQSDWRGWLAARAAGAPAGLSLPAASLAQTVAAAFGTDAPAGQASGGLWLASPVHYFAGLDSVFLHAAGLLTLEAAEQHTLVADFERVFRGSPWTLRSIGRRELLLAGPAIAAGGADPAQFAGCDPSAGLPSGPGAATLRGLGAEMEMWLYEHPLNLERCGRGELPVTTLWLWGAQQNPGPPATAGLQSPMHAQPAQPAQLYGSDTYAEALWRLQGGAARPLPAAFDAAAIGPGADAIFVYSLRKPQGLSAALLQFEQCWLPGALQALRRRRVAVLRVLVGTQLYTLRWLDLARLWRRRTPWWETLA